jgi:hypothetical protein
MKDGQAVDEVAKTEDGRLGYSLNNGGLTNQKLALLGLFVKAFLTKKPLLLPMMLIKDHVNKQSRPIAFEDVFEVPAIRRFASENGFEIIDGHPPDSVEESWPYFGAGAGRMAHLALHQNVEDDISKFIFGFFENLVPRIRSSDVLKKVAQQAFEVHDIQVTAQFRIESDWKFHSAVTLKPTIKSLEDFYIPYDQIVAKIIKTLPETKKILVFCDEAALLTPKSEMYESCRAAFDVELFWKSDFLSAEDIASLNNLELSLLDFELATAGKNYVGISRSTFSNMVTFEKFARTRQSVTTDYIYNNNLSELSLRADNGGGVNPASATK